jgi:hypothetical protein
MSRGPGKWQLTILQGLRRSNLFPLRGATRAETASLRRAARELEEDGQCVVVRIREGERGRATNYAARAPEKRRE